MANPRLWLSECARGVLTRFADELQSGAATDLGFRGDRPTAVDVMLSFSRRLEQTLAFSPTRPEEGRRYWDVRVEDDLARGEEGPALSERLEWAIAEFERRRRGAPGATQNPIETQPKTREPLTIPMALLRAIAGIGASHGYYPVEQLRQFAAEVMPGAKERVSKLGNGGARELDVPVDYGEFGPLDAEANAIGLDAHLSLVDAMAERVRDTPEFKSEWTRSAAKRGLR